MLRSHLNRKNPCRPRNPIPAPQPELDTDLESTWTEFLKYLGVVPWCTENSNTLSPIENSNAQASSSADVPKFELTNVINSGVELLDAHCRVQIGKESIYSHDPINSLNTLREQIIKIFNERFDLTHGFKTRLCLVGKLSRSANYQQGLFDDKIEEDNSEKDYKEVPFKNKAVVVTSKEDIPRIVDKLIWDIEKRVYVREGSVLIFHYPKGLPKRNNGIINIKNEDEYCILAELFPAQHHRERVSWYTPHLRKLNFNGIQFPVKADNDTMKKFEKQNPAISVSIYGWSEKELIPIRIAPKSKIDAQHMEDCEGINTPVQRTGMPKEGKNTYKFKRIERMMDAPFTCYVDAEGFTKKINEKRGTNTTAIQEHEPSGLDYIIIRSDGQFKAPVQIRGADPAGDFIKAMEKETEIISQVDIYSGIALLN
ncbi:6332_t:CDS:2 [Paraglomus brasilianum]|uniref:6332_t:CDS:1 n=1 Tax=Paraglomus brasilianum TaxID=144538 RepID=A0A9N9DUZ5_9GLOM|nr:6332_t:CDS:2 [Paraglomus brasilianum]